MCWDVLQNAADTVVPAAAQETNQADHAYDKAWRSVGRGQPAYDSAKARRDHHVAALGWLCDMAGGDALVGPSLVRNLLKIPDSRSCIVGVIQDEGLRVSNAQLVSRAGTRSDSQRAAGRFAGATRCPLSKGLPSPPCCVLSCQCAVPASNSPLPSNKMTTVGPALASAVAFHPHMRTT